MLLPNQSSVHNNTRPCNIVARWTCKVDDSASEIVRNTPSFRWCSTYNVIIILWISSIDLCQCRLYISIKVVSSDFLFNTLRTSVKRLPWCNTVHLDTVAGPFIAHCLGHLKDATFGTCIRGDIDVCNKGNDRGDIDDLSRSAQLQKLFANLLRGNI